MMEDMPSLSERPKWELSPVQQLKVAAYRRDLGNAEMRQGHPEKVPAAAASFADRVLHRSFWMFLVRQLM